MLFLDLGYRELFACFGVAADRPMHCTGIIFDFPLRFRLLYRYFRLSSTTATITATVTTPCTSSCLVGDGRSLHSRATLAVIRGSYRSGVITNAPLLISVFCFFFAQPAKMVWITADDQVPSSYDRNRFFLLCYDLLKFAFIFN